MKKSARILVVDDEVETLGLIELTLQTAGFEVETCHSGQEAISRLSQERYDLVLLDIMMPDVSGFDVMRHLHNNMPSPPPVIFLTAMQRPEDRETGMDLGAVDYLTKPVTRGQLLDSITNALGL